MTQQLKDESFENYVVKTLVSRYSPNRYAIYIYDKDKVDDVDHPKYHFIASARTKEELMTTVKAYLKKQDYKQDGTEKNNYTAEIIEEYDSDGNEKTTEE